MNRSIEDCLRDIRDHAVRGMQYAGDSSGSVLSTPGLERDALAFCLIAIGEAAKSVPHALLSTEPSIRWSAIVRTQDRLAHNYWGIDGDVLVKIVNKDLEPLIAAVGRLLAGLASDQ